MPSFSTKQGNDPAREGSATNSSRVGHKTTPSLREKCFLWLEVGAFGAFIIGGLGTLAGLGCILFADQRDLGFWGQGRSLGLLLICVGLCLSVAGVLLVRFFRNRQWV